MLSFVSVQEGKTDEDQITELISKLKRRNDKSFEHFLTALRKSEQGFIADHLTEQLRLLTDGNRSENLQQISCL
jgi:hypothetical protein